MPLHNEWSIIPSTSTSKEIQDKCLKENIYLYAFTILSENI